MPLVTFLKPIEEVDAAGNVRDALIGLEVVDPNKPGQPEGNRAALDEWDAGDDPGPIPPRQWLLGNQFCRGFISSIVAAGGTGKTALRFVQLISLALGRPLCGQHVFRRCRVLLISLEDDRNEMERRIKAVLDHYKIDRAELKGWLFVATPKLAKLAVMNGRARIVGPLEQQIRDAIARRKPDIVSLDPFIKTHSLVENDVGDMDFVCDLLARLAAEHDIAVDSPHHVHKGQMTPGDADSGRGSSGIKDAGRLVYTLVTMSADEAKTFNIDPDLRCSYIRLDPAKINIAARATKATWFHLIGVPIDNGTEDYPQRRYHPGCRAMVAAEHVGGHHARNPQLDSQLHRGGDTHGQRYSNAPNAGKRAVWPVVQQATRKSSRASAAQSSTHGSTAACSTPTSTMTRSITEKDRPLCRRPQAPRLTIRH